MTDDKLYAERDIEQLDKDGDYYFKHVLHMTREALHSKSDIAAELAWRDREIDRLKASLPEAIEQTHMAGQADAGVDPSFSNAQAYRIKESK